MVDCQTKGDIFIIESNSFHLGSDLDRRDWNSWLVLDFSYDEMELIYRYVHLKCSLIQGYEQGDILCFSVTDTWRVCGP